MFGDLKRSGLAGLIRRNDGRVLHVLDIEDRDGKSYLHIQGCMIDFWATPAELISRGYWLLVAKRAVWDLWSPIFAERQARSETRGGYLC